MRCFQNFHHQFQPRRAGQKRDKVGKSIIVASEGERLKRDAVLAALPLQPIAVPSDLDDDQVGLNLHQ